MTKNKPYKELEINERGRFAVEHANHQLLKTIEKIVEAGGGLNEVVAYLSLILCADDKGNTYITEDMGNLKRFIEKNQDYLTRLGMEIVAKAKGFI